jgi:cardiolipin synthase
MLDPIADKLLVSSCLLLLAADTDGPIAGWSLWAAIIILCREILVSGLREYLADLKVSVPVTRSPSGRPRSRWWPSPSCWPAPPATRSCPTRRDRHRPALGRRDPDLYTGYDYFRAGLKHIVDE